MGADTNRQTLNFGYSRNTLTESLSRPHNIFNTECMIAGSQNISLCIFPPITRAERQFRYHTIYINLIVSESTKMHSFPLFHLFTGKLGKRLTIIASFSLLSACAMSPVPIAQRQAVESSAMLGTQWGEGRESRVETISARRLTPNKVDALATISYKESGGSAPSGDRQLNLLLADGRIEWSIHDEGDRPMPITMNRDGGAILAATRGARYTLVFTNRSQHQYEVVSTVDGLDVLNGKPGSQNNAGYVLAPYARLVIDGFRKSKDEVATFRFSAPERAYAANTPAGEVRNIGIIGTALFRLDLPDATRRDTEARPNPFPADSKTQYAPPPRY